MHNRQIGIYERFFLVFGGFFIQSEGICIDASCCSLSIFQGKDTLAGSSQHGREDHAGSQANQRQKRIQPQMLAHQPGL